jgi:glycosyltransferase involved in cell wall biosynthesis
VGPEVGSDDLPEEWALRIGYLVPEFPTQTHAFFWREARALRSMGHDVRLLSTRRPDPDACRHAFAGEARRETLYVYPPTLRSWRGGWRALPRLPDAVGYLAALSASRARERLEHMALLACALELSAICERHRVEHIHVHSAASAAHLVALARRMGGPPYSVTLHGDLAVYGRDHALKFKDAEFIAAVTRPLQRQIVELGVPESRVKVLWMGVDTDRFTAVPGARGGDGGTLQVATVARLHPNKGHRFALQALRRLEDAGVPFRYTIAGGGEARAALEAQVRSLGLEGAVHFTGTISEEDVLALLRKADVFLLPSVALGEAAPVSVMEAMSCASVGVVSRIGGTPDLVEDGVDGFLVEQEDVDGIFRRLAELGKDAELRRRMGAAARSKAVRLFDCRQTAALLAREIATAHAPEPAAENAA